MSASRLHSEIQRNFLRMHPGSTLTMIDCSIRDYEVTIPYGVLRVITHHWTVSNCALCDIVFALRICIKEQIYKYLK